MAGTIELCHGSPRQRLLGVDKRETGEWYINVAVFWIGRRERSRKSLLMKELEDFLKPSYNSRVI